MQILSTLAKALAFVLRVVKVGVVTSICLGLFLGGMVTNHLVSVLNYAPSTQPCFVPKAVTIACLRQENKSHYNWKIVAVKNEGTLSAETIVIQYTTPKYKVQFIGY